MALRLRFILGLGLWLAAIWLAFGFVGLATARSRPGVGSEVARQLGNTRAVCRKCYIHPAVIDAYVDGSLAQAMTGPSLEACVKRLLARRKPPRSLVPALKRSLSRLRRRGTHVAAANQLRKGAIHAQAA